MNLVDKKILLGISGSIAAYKTPELVRQLVKQGAQVKVIMTKAAVDFVSPLVLATVSKNEVLTENFENNNWNSHVELGLWADVFLLAPASANTLAKMSNGECDNLLLATILSLRCSVFVAPAMDVDMYNHAITQDNIALLKSFGVNFIGPATGELASGLIGEGRMETPEIIIEKLVSHFLKSKLLSGKKIVITAGPTREAIDPVRYISNHSTGKMGFAIAREAISRGAEVTVITGKGALLNNTSEIKKVMVDSADEMFEASKKYFTDADIFIMAAAVADYKTALVSDQKIKKSDKELQLNLIKTVDIASELGKLKTTQFLVGFALETSNEIENAMEKLKRKNLNLIVLNSLNDEGAGFAGDSNKITIIDSFLNTVSYDLKSKSEVAVDIMDFISKNINK